ncbi:hypothetical protein HYH03_008330 [Edaphochlamys debaryana]|uniref:ABC transporter domain-containing protein n=1 Tax=Edaphochlamys debaryana TaxID=47281 RepID=A0A835Y0J5_9CHLO|nr:hypothetical protein HYH03_008330 [Edaphochlamys debaryana]|eukprot:KAG2493515.1 hypothetical protein HYH03_008330 [Edaphochlamys debaryana]
MRPAGGPPRPSAFAAPAASPAALSTSRQASQEPGLNLHPATAHRAGSGSTADAAQPQPQPHPYAQPQQVSAAEAAAAAEAWREERQRRLNVLTAARMHSGDAQLAMGTGLPMMAYEGSDPVLLASHGCETLRTPPTTSGAHHSFEERAAGMSDDEATDNDTAAAAAAVVAGGAARHSYASLRNRLSRVASGASGTSAATATATTVESNHLLAAAGPDGNDNGNGDEATFGELLAPLHPNNQVVLRFDFISSFVRAQLQPPSLAQRGRQAAVWLGERRRRARERRAQAAAGGAEAAGAKPSSPATRVVPRRQILYDVSGKVVPGQVLALMGPSGSGKTSLLSVLGGRAPSQVEVRGHVTVDGVPLTKAVRRRIGFVLQDDVLYETLTVHETLLYAAQLRLPGGMSAAEKRRRVDAVLAGLGLSKSRDTIIGGFFRRGISGGERKRVSVGHELLIDPAVLMLDEPTSGLDSTTALHLVQMLRQLASGGRAIITTIHQPSSRLYRQLDRLMLLAEGHVMYCGDANLAAEWFGHFGFGLPYGVSLADFILDCAAGEVVASQAAADEAAAAAESGGRRASARSGSGYPAPSAPPLALPPGAGAAGGGVRVAEGLTGRPAIVGLYRTFEIWYAAHPEGFCHPSQLAGVELEAGAGAGEASTRPGPGAPKLGVTPEGPETEESMTRRKASAAAASPAGPQDLSPDPLAARGGGGAGAVGGGGGTGKGGANGGAAAGVPPSPFSLSSGADGAAGAEGGGSATASAANAGGRGGASYVEQLRILTTRAIKVRRFESLSGQNLVQMLAVALITGLLWFQRGRGSSISVGTDVTGLLFFELLFPSFRSLFSALFTFPTEYRLLKKERPAGMYRLSAYYLARTASDLPIELFYPTIFITVVYWLGGLRPTAVVMLTFLLVGGFYVRQVPVWIGWIKYISFVYWGYNLLLKVQFRGNTYLDAAGRAVNVQSALGLPTNPNASPAAEVLVLLAMLAVLRSLTYVVLRRKTEVRPPKQAAP